MFCLHLGRICNRAIKGKVCYAVADLNLDVEMHSLHDLNKYRNTQGGNGLLRMRIDGLVVYTRSDCSVRDLMLILNKEFFDLNGMSV